jgi:hypothetical protein
MHTRHRWSQRGAFPPGAAVVQAERLTAGRWDEPRHTQPAVRCLALSAFKLALCDLRECMLQKMNTDTSSRHSDMTLRTNMRSRLIASS